MLFAMQAEYYFAAVTVGSENNLLVISQSAQV